MKRDAKGETDRQTDRDRQRQRDREGGGGGGLTMRARKDCSEKERTRSVDG